MLYVNGVYVQRGPCRFNPKRPEFDTAPVTALLHAGENSLVVLVHSYGAGVINGRIMAHAPGLAARLDVDGVVVASTDSTWRCSASTEYRPSPAAWSSIPDVIDARVAPAGGAAWRDAGYNDSAWERAVSVDGAQWGALQPRSIPLPLEAPLSSLSVMPASTPLVLPLVLAPGASVVINLGRMAMTYIDADVQASTSGAALAVVFALRFHDGAPDETYGVGSDYSAAGAGVVRVVGGDTWCAHYVTITAAAGGGGVTLTGLRFVERSYPFVRVGAFASGSDALLTEVWRRAVNTLAVVTDDAYGSDARERNEWLQDPAEPNFITTRVAFVTADGVPSDARLLRNLLRHAALSALPDGRILSTFPTDRGSEDCHYSIEDYAMQYVEALRMYYDSTGDAAFLAETYPVLRAQMAYFAARVANTSTPHALAKGLLFAREYTSFDDPLAYVFAQGGALNAFYFKSLLDSAAISTTLGYDADAAAFSTAALAVQTAFNEVLFDNATGTYSAGVLPTGEVLGPSVHAALLALERGIVPLARVESVRVWFLANYKNAGSTHCCTNNDTPAMIAAKSGIDFPVVYYWVFRVLYSMDTAAGDTEALSEMRRRWGPMVSGSPDIDTLWESFQDSESCHNYGAVPAFFLSSYVLGVRLDGPAARRALLVEPRLGDLTDAAGTVVTELGVVRVAWARVGGALTFALELPEGMATAALRLADCDGATLVVNGAATPTSQDGRYAVAMLGLGGNFTGSISLL